MLEKILKRNYKKIIIGVLIMFVLFIQTTFAADNEILGASVKDFQEGLKFFLDIGFFLAGVVSALVGWLMTTDWTTGAIFGLDGIFKDLWVLISNIVYFVFAFLLIAIAFMNIIGKGGESFALKTALPKFIVGVLIVPFTWFIVQFFISLSTVLTVSVLSLPSDIISPEELTRIDSKVQIPANGCVIDLNAIDSKGGFVDCDTSGEKINASEYLETQPFGILYSYLYGVFNFQDLLKLDTSSWFKGATSIADIVIKLVFNFAFFLVFLVILMALFIALFVRTVYLWIYTIFSPIFGLGFFFGGEGGGEMMKKFNFKEFLSLVMVPVYVAAALSFGLLFISVISTDHKYHGQTVKAKKEGSIVTATLEPMTLEIIGDVFPYTHDSANVFARFIMYLIGIGVLRMGTMVAFKSSEITRAAVEPVINIGKNVGSLLTKLPQYTPIPGLGMNMDSMEELSQVPGRTLQNVSVRKTSKYAQRMRTAMGLGDAITVEEMSNLQNRAKNAKTIGDLEALMKEVEIQARKYGRDDREVQKMEKTIFEILSKRHKGGKLGFATSYLGTKGINPAEFLDNEGEITVNAAKLILGTQDQNEANLYLNTRQGDGTAGSGRGGTAAVIINTWNATKEEQIVVGDKERVDEKGVNGENLIRLVKGSDGKLSIQTLSGGEIITLDSFSEGMKLSEESIKERNIKELEKLLRMNEFNLSDLNPIFKEIFGSGVSKLDIENYIREYHKKQKETEEKRKSKEDK